MLTLLLPLASTAGEVDLAGSVIIRVLLVALVAAIIIWVVGMFNFGEPMTRNVRAIIGVVALVIIVVLFARAYL